MAKFIETPTTIKKQVTKKKKKETPSKTKSPSTTEEVKSRLTQKYGGGSSYKSYSEIRSSQNSSGNSGSNDSSKSNTAPFSSRNPRIQDTPTTVTRRYTPATAREMQQNRSQGRTSQDTQQNQREKRYETAEEMRRERQAQKSGLNSMGTPEQQEAARRAAKNTPLVAKESAKQALIGHGKTAADITAANNSAAIGSKIDIKSADFQKDIEKRRLASTAAAEKAFNELSKKQETSETLIRNATKDAKGLEKAYYGALESGTGMLTDMGVGALTGTGQAGSLAAMASRTYGTTRGQAQKEGATENEDRLYSAIQAAKETGTELMFPGAGLARKAYGRTGRNLGEIASNVLLRNLKGRPADAASSMLRLGGGVLEENAEELAGWGLDPLIKEFTYGKNTRRRNAKAEMQARSADLRANIENEDDARAAAAYLSSDSFISETISAYKEAGLSQAEAEETAEKMRDYLTASLTGDTDRMAELEDEVSKKLAGGLSLKNWDFGELKDTVAATTLLTGVTGLPGAVTTSMKGSELREQLGSEGVSALAKTAIDFEDEDMSRKAKAMNERIESGKELTSTQVYELQVGMQEQVDKDVKRETASRSTATNTIERENLVMPYAVDRRTGTAFRGEVTEQTFQEEKSNAIAVINKVADESKESLTDVEMDTGSSAIANFQTGTFTVNDANALNWSNTAVRAAFTEATGIDLTQYIVKNKDGSVNIPATNAATKDALFALAAENLVQSARAETANWMDNTKGEVVTQIAARMGAKGSEMLQQSLDTVDERNRSEYMMTANAADMLYQSGKNMGIEWKDIKDEVTAMFPGISDESKLQAMYEAGLEDRRIEADVLRGRQVEMGKALAVMGEQETATGNVIIDTEMPLKGTVIRTFTEIAKNLGADIHLTDAIRSVDGTVIERANGSYDPNTNTFYLNVETGMEKNLGYIFMHEMTHYLKSFAPEQYLELENLVREKWFSFNPEQMQDAIARKIESYKIATNGTQVLTEEQALEEIICDAAHEFLNDPNFARTVAEEDMGLAKAVLDSIRHALRMLRRIFATGSIEDETHMNTLFSQLDILTEAEEIWLRAYKQAVKNQAAVGMVEWENSAFAVEEESDALANEIEAERFSIVEDKELIKRLEADSHINTYRAMALIDGKLYPPMATKVKNENGKWQLQQGMDIGQWVESDITTDPAMFDNKGRFLLRKDIDGTPVPAAYNPYIHSSDSMLNDQFAIAYRRPNMVVVEGEIPESELTSGYRAEHDLDDGRHVVAKDTTGITDWKAGVVQGQLSGKRTVYLTQHFKPTRIVPDSEVAQHINDKVAGTGVVIPYNVVTPSVRAELQKLGTEMAQSKEAKYYVEDAEAPVRYSINDADIMSVEETQKRLEENFDDYKEDKDNLRLATEAIADLQDVRYSVEENTSSVSGRWSRGEQVRTIGKGITADLVNEGYVEFRGRKVKGPEDLAKLCQVLRDPRFETFRVVLTKGDKIVSLRSISSRLPGLAQAFESENISDGVDIVRDRMKRTGADGYYLIHNHPSGNVTASFADLSVTRAYLALLGQDTYKGHIILDHDKYGFIDADVPQVIRGENFPTAREESITGQQTFDLIHEPEIDHPLLGEEIHGHADIAKCGQFVNASDDVSVLLYTNSPGEVTGIQEISNKTLKNNKEITGFIRNQGVEFGAASAFLYTTDIETYQASKDLVKSGHLVDSVVAYGNNRQWSESAREVVSPRADVEVLGQVHDDVIRRTHVFESATGVTEYKYSLPETDNEGKSLTEDQRTFFRNVAPELLDENGNIKRYFHGTARADRVGYYFNPERATSGPMAYFTDNRDIAANYSRDKADTSLAYEGEDINDYHNQFVVDVDGEEVRLEDYWYQLPANKKLEYREKAGQITYDYDGEDDRVLVIDENVSTGNGGYGADPYLVRQARGNAFKMLIDAWLDSGDFFNEEERFLEVMNLLGVEGVRYKDPNYRDEKVYEVYLNVTNPLVTTDLDEEFAADVEDWLDNTDLDYYARESASADMWDKNDRDPYDWLESLRDDIENGTTHVWTSIPDVITDFLREQGYDGIVDQGGKYHEAGHQVVIPFEPNQIKLTTNEHPTEDVDIRYSIAETDSEGNLLSDGQRSYFNNSLAVDEQGRMQVVYHTTNSGGFTVFDPSYSDDRRSLFFASNFDVSQTYGSRSNKPIEFMSAEDQELADEFPFIAGEELLEKQRGFYQVYLNLENPLIVDAKGANWNRIPYGTVKPNPIREQTLARMESEAEMIVDHISMEWDDFDDNFEGGNYRTLNFELTGKIRMEDGSFDDWSVVESFTIDEEKFAELASSDFDTPGSILSEELGEYWTETLRLSYDYFEEVMNYANDMDGSVDYDSQLANQEAAPDYITNDGYKIDYAELFDELNEEAGEDYSPYEGVATQTYRTRELAEMAEANDNDGVIIRNCRDIGGVSRLKGNNPYSDIFIAFSSNQVKDTRNTDPTNVPDIRYSIVDDDEAMSKMAHDYAYDTSHEALEYYESLIGDLTDKETDRAYRKAKQYVEQNVDRFYAGLEWYSSEMRFDDVVLEEGRERMASSKADFMVSSNAKWNESWYTEGRVLNTKTVKTPIRKLVMSIMRNSDTTSKYKTDLVNKTIVNVRLAYFYAKQGRTEIADAILWHSALGMIENVDFIDDTTFKSYKDLRDYLRTTRISLNEEYWSDVDYQAFRKNNFGRINLVSGKTNVDQIYQEMCELWPEWFKEDEDMTPPDQLARMEQVLEAIQPYKIAYSSEEAAEMAFDIASDLFDIMQEGEEYQSLADKFKEKYDAKTKALKQRHAEAMRQAKANVKKAEKDKAKAKFKEYKEKYDAKTKALKQRHAEAMRQAKANVKKAEKDKAKAKFKEYKEKQREKKFHSKYFESIRKSHAELVKRLTTNTKDKHIPEQYKRELAALLGAFDFQTVRSKNMELKKGADGYVRLDVSKKTIELLKVQATLKAMESKSQFFHVNDSITEIMDQLLGIDEGSYNESMNIEGKTIDELNSEQLKRIDKMLKSLLHEFNTYENVRVGIKKQKAEDIGGAQIESSLAHAEKFGNGRDYHNFLGAMDRIINLDELTPAYLMKQIDPQNDGIGIMYKELRRSFDKYIRNQSQLNDWMEEIVGEYHRKGIAWNKYGAGALADWRSINHAKTFQLSNGKTIELTPAQMMSIHCLAKRPQAYNHMVGAGIVVKPVSFQAKLMSDLKHKANYALPVQLTDADIRLIESKLTPDQIKVADKLQELMATKMAAWGNEASMSVIGINLFEDPDYFPIKSDRAALEKDFTADQFTDMIRNFGFTKAVAPKAKNAIAVDDIFDVVTEHCNNMNLYNAYTESLNDFMKVYNYHQVGPDGSDYSVEQAIAYGYSQKATTFIRTFIQDLNGNVSKGRTTGLNDMMNDALGKAKKASVFANGRVALQQPTALVRAFAVISPKYMKDIKPSKAAMKEMFEHCPIALWKSWGYYDINMGKSIEDLMMNNGSWVEDTMSDIYGKLDNATWSMIWQMVKGEVKDKNPSVKEGSDEFFDLCNERMTEVVDLTQVVDSPFHRSHAMRDKQILTKMFTAFMAEPTLTFNMVRDGFNSAKESLRSGDKAKAAKIIGRTSSVFVLQAATVAAAAAIWDALRGKNPDKDDEDENALDLWWENTVENFKDNINLLNNVYYVKDVVSIFQGWDQRNLGLQGYKHLADAWGQLTGSHKVSSQLSWYENALAGIGYLTGIPFKTMQKDGKAILNLLGVHPQILSDMDDYLTAFQDVFGGEASASGVSSSPGDKDKSKKNKKKKSEDNDSVTEARLWTYEESPIKFKDGSLADQFLNSMGINLTASELKAIDEEKKRQEMHEKVESIKEKTESLSGEEKDKKVWNYISTYMKSENEDKSVAELVESGDYMEIERFRNIYEAAGGDTDYFDERIFANSKKAMKKSIINDPTQEQIEAQKRIKSYLINHGMTYAELSEIAYKSDTARDLKVAFRINDEDAAVEELVPLLRAGLSDEDYEKLYKNRRRMDLKAYKENGGKYADRLQSVGKYIWPISGKTYSEDQITSHYGYRNSPTAGASSYHQAIDIAAPTGTPVVAADGGTVIFAGWNGAGGKTVKVQHDDGTITYYQHLSWWDAQEGDIVSQGQTIGNVGSTGASTGPHLDIRFEVNGELVDPLEYLAS